MASNIMFVFTTFTIENYYLQLATTCYMVRMSPVDLLAVETPCLDISVHRELSGATAKFRGILTCPGTEFSCTYATRRYASSTRNAATELPRCPVSTTDAAQSADAALGFHTAPHAASHTAGLRPCSGMRRVFVRKGVTEC